MSTKSEGRQALVDHYRNKYGKRFGQWTDAQAAAIIRASFEAGVKFATGSGAPDSFAELFPGTREALSMS